MDILSSSPPSKPAEQKSWPNARAVRGVTYGVNDPVFQIDRLVVMLWDTWVDFGTVHEALKRKVAQQDKTLVALNAAKDVLVAQLAQTQTRLDNLRASEKKRRRASVGIFDNSTKDSEK